MAIIKCKMCGGDMELSPDKTFGTCDYCGSVMTLPKVDDEQRAAAFNRGNHFRRIGEFDKALAVYERIVAEDDGDAEAHWCCALCRFGIEYVEDPNTFEYLPTCHRASFDSFLEDVDYLAALEHSDGITKRQYQKDGAKIAEVQRGILATSRKEEPFDVFICYKETDDETKERTRDSLDAQEIYYNLTQEGYRVFFARITLEDKAGAEYEPYIFAALNSAKVMVVIGEKAEYFSAVWVKNEWSRFLSLMRKDRSKLLLPCYKNVDPYDLPEQLSVLQSYDMTKIGFMQDLIRGVKKVLAKDEPKVAAQPVVQQVVQQSAGGANLAAQLKRGQQALEDRDWQAADGFFDKALDMDAECAEAFFGKALAAAQCVDGEALVRERIARAQPQEETLTACDTDAVRIKDAIQQYAIPEYFPVSEIRKLFGYDERKFGSYTAGWETCIADERKYWEQTDRNLSRAMRYAKGDTAREYQGLRDAVVSAMEAKLAESRAADEKEKARLVQLYAEEMEKASQASADIYAEAVKRRQYNYESYCRNQEKAVTWKEYEEAAAWFERKGMIDFADSRERAGQCRAEAARRKAEQDAEIARKKEEERAAAEARAKAEAEEAERQRIAAEKAAAAKRKKTIIGVSAAAAAVVVIAAALLLIFKVIIPGNKYKAANALLAAGDYDAAISTFEGIIDYKDSKHLLEDAKLQKGQQFINSKEYEAAYALLLEIGRDDIIASNKFDRASAMIDAGDYDEAYYLLNEIGRNDIVTTSKFDRALAMFDVGDYDTAYDLLYEIGRNDVVLNSKYERAISLIDTESFEAAYVLLKDLQHKDSQELLKIIQEKSPGTQIKLSSKGDIVTFGKYEQDSKSAGKEQIEWIVLIKNEKKHTALLISKNALYKCAFQDTSGLNNRYAVSNPRRWLNDTFFNSAFNVKEQELMLETNVVSIVVEGVTHTLSDKVFLLSQSEATSYLSDNDRKCKMYNDKSTYVDWWLRTEDGWESVYYVNDDGRIFSMSMKSTSGIRPATWVCYGD